MEKNEMNLENHNNYWDNKKDIADKYYWLCYMANVVPQ